MTVRRWPGGEGFIAARRDKIVPPACAEALAKASGADITWYAADHYSMIVYLPASLIRLIRHFGANE